MLFNCLAALDDTLTKTITVSRGVAVLSLLPPYNDPYRGWANIYLSRPYHSLSRVL